MIAPRWRTFSPARRCPAAAAEPGFSPGEPRRDIAGVETVARRGGVDRFDDLGRRDELLPSAGRDQCAVRAVLDHDLADAERLQPFDRRLGTGIAPQHRFVVEGRQRDVDAFERLHENGAGAGQVALPALRPEIAVEGDLGALLARHLDDGQQPAEPGVGIKRQRNAGKENQPRAHHALGDAIPVGQLEQLARRRLAAPVAEAPLALAVGLDHVEPGETAGHAQHQVGLDAFGRGHRNHAVGVGVVAERGGVSHVDPGARQIDRRVERVAAAGHAETAIAATGHFDHHLADGDHTAFLIAHFKLPAHAASPHSPEPSMARRPAPGNASWPLRRKSQRKYSQHERLRVAGTRHLVIL